MDKTEILLQEITSVPGVSGYEGQVRSLIRRYLEPVATIEHDKMGSIIGKKQGTAASPCVMLAGHMDEIGFMVKLLTSDGFIRFVALGGWFDQVLLGHRVVSKRPRVTWRRHRCQAAACAAG